LHSYYQYGQPLARFTATVDRYSLEPMVVAANTDLFDRLLKAYPRYFVWPNEDFGAWGLVFLAGIGLGLWRFRESALPLLWSGALLAFFNFGSARLDRYVALPVATRLIMIALPPLFRPHCAARGGFVARRRSRAWRDQLGGMARENTPHCRWSLPDSHRHGGLGYRDESRVTGCRYPKRESRRRILEGRRQPHPRFGRHDTRRCPLLSRVSWAGPTDPL